MTADAHWQVQEAKQRFSELLRAVSVDGPQYVTKHGNEVAVVIDIADYHKLRGTRGNFVDQLLAFPDVGDEFDEVMDRIVHQRRNDLGRDIDLS